MTKYEKKRFKMLQKKLKKEGVRSLSYEEIEELKDYFIEDNFRLDQQIKILNVICGVLMCSALILSAVCAVIKIFC